MTNEASRRPTDPMTPPSALEGVSPRNYIGVNVPSNGVTSIVPEGMGNRSQVVATQGTSTLPVEFDDGYYALAGQMAGKPTSLGVAGNAIKTGDPVGLEYLDYGALEDGTPAVAFTDESGNRQVVRITAAQLLSGLKNRDLSRQEMQFRVDAKNTKDRIGHQFRAMISHTDFTDANRQRLRMLWEMDPNTAMKSANTIRTSNIKRDYERRMIGGEEVLGKDAMKLFQERGIQIPNTARASDWSRWFQQLNDSEVGQEMVNAHGEPMTLIEAAPLLKHYIDIGLRAKGWSEANATSVKQIPNIDQNLSNVMSMQMGTLSTRARTNNHLALPATASLVSVTQPAHWPQIAEDLVLASFVSGQYQGGLADFSEEDDDGKNNTAVESLIDSFDQIQSRQLGWSPMSPEERDIMHSHIRRAATALHNKVGVFQWRTSEKAAALQSQLDINEYISKRNTGPQDSPLTRRLQSNDQTQFNATEDDYRKLAEAAGMPNTGTMSIEEVRDFLATILNDKDHEHHERVMTTLRSQARR